MSLKKLFVKDTYTGEITEHSSVLEVYEFIRNLLDRDFCINSIYKNKHRGMRVCRRFYVSENTFFKSKFSSKKELPIKKIVEKCKTDRKNKKWFKNKTRVISQ